MACPLKNPLFFLLFIFLPFPTTAQTYRNISLGSSLTALKDNNSSWLSPSGEFAFGFLEIAKDGFLLAIWFNKIPNQTIVWSANGDNLVPKGSKVELTIDGEFMLNGKRIRNTESVGTGVAFASMLDTGNFVLANRNSSIVWESFSYPTDTILPSQTLNQNGILYARYTATNYSSGRFLFSLKPDRNLVLATTRFPQITPNYLYWSVKNPNIGFRFIFNESGFIYVTSKNGSLLSTISSNMVSMQEFYQRATLEYDGVFRHYVYPKSTSSSARRWAMAWSTSSSPFVPPNICTSIMESTGGGACGLNSFCTIEEQGPTCQCPNGYSFIDPEDERRGCKQNFAQQSCGETSKEETDLFEFQELNNANCWGGDYAFFEGVPEDWCRQNCLDDCFCAVAHYNSAGRCYKKRLPFLNGVIDPNITGKTLIKVGKQNSTVKWGGGSNTEKKDDKTLIIFGSVILSGSGILNFLLPLITYLVVSRAYSRKAKVCQPYPVISGMNLKHFTYEELNNATNQFEEELGRGASAIVFKGVLASDNGKSVAVKSLDTRVRENELEFKAEVSAIGRTNHRNLVQLLGFCYEGEHRILVYEFMSNGSLAGVLFGESKPNWYQRRQIALEIARGLLYLHEESSSQIIHLDIKPQNILLDDSLTARISDFGLAKLLRTDQTLTTTGIRGTKGYAAAEDEGPMILADWAYDCYKQNKLHQLFKNNDEAMHDMKMEDPSLRPNMKKVTLMLEGTVEVSAPPDPSSFISSIL
ncbi:G-type lectin S-receptor-like serine/threonine-protein kinase RLK1 [Pyrus ussuriensis x Pyrus communis]|uniref:Receptor-like serine/threonine-protein kinase n=1 Tax=Pyrus ussuriensis x Pyrus communis TaxID=2448454 RepID=A0A5N5FLZ4_9ROSA|nr:G-type lectin S-receptor-like serine/threonine-protein kinase RLK1 [Pyrus ussuriensis x Pyrus communis]KAB2607358.1 G-type lectin S-receptor-like serine/threonine-protein kinase RLK1 [Pyrus ussuriensis x Pyrus communis]